MANRVELIFDFVSPNAYLIWGPLRDVVKRTGAELDAKQLVPLEFGGVPTDVVEVGSRHIDVHNELDSRWIANSQASASFMKDSNLPRTLAI